MEKSVTVSYNWPAAFVAYSRGVPIEELAEVYGIPEIKLATTIRQQQWAILASKLPTMQPAPLEPVEATRMNVMMANREKNYQIACSLRDDLVAVIEGLRSAGAFVEETVQGDNGPVVVQRPAGKLRRYWHNRGAIIEKFVDWSLSDRVALANYATMVANLTYTALGDKQAAGGAQDRKADDPTPPSITIIMPGAIAAPRSQRSAAITVDLSEGPAPEQLKDAKSPD